MLQTDVKLAIDNDFYLEKVAKAIDPSSTAQQVPRHKTLENSESSSHEGMESRKHNKESDSSDSDSESSKKVSQMLRPKNPEQNPELVTRSLRDRSTIKPPIRFGFHHYYKPNTFESAIQCKDDEFWKLAIEKEVNSIENHEVWDNHYDELPNPLDTTWG